MSDSSAADRLGASGVDPQDGFCARFGQLLAALNISQNEFARQLGSTSAFISNLARGKSRPGLDFLAKISTTFGVSLDWLVLGKGTLRGDPFIDPEWLHTAALRVELAMLMAAGNPEAKALVSELLGERPPALTVTPARQALLDMLAAATSRDPLVTSLYNRYLSQRDPVERARAALRAAMQQLQANSSDPLAALINQSKQAPDAGGSVVQTAFGGSNKFAGGDFHEH
ncbi:helix-turn-helix domain-containing protein [Uliginosibacterium aquaticum]|uniref:Helix-turn-helix transcriptional regulator n=1 Tax=Uliginosibacterium aquaticum TaxID=2731212 RepID=A0ABX2IG41_9RHOO|nr:helix-turn-helix transcriptional regulator [Uliginosibacterium aquaticum]NSL53544.1 helix-turn-helix transcriptional regulator [Uliginosibacterium aquaticum]